MNQEHPDNNTLYTGRIVALGISPGGKACVMYRVSSRSFPNRIAQVGKDRISIVPLKGYEQDVFINPYITYHSIRIVKDSIAVVSNGSHTDIIAEKIAIGMSLRDALALTLLSMDYEKDLLCTPRIAGVIDAESQSAFLGIIKKQSIHVASVSLLPGELCYICTYEKDSISTDQKEPFNAVNAVQAAKYLMEHKIFSQFSHGIVSVSAFEQGSSFSLSSYPSEYSSF